MKGIFLVLLGIIPGVPGETLYKSFVGGEPENSSSRRTIRTVVISVAGLILYIITGDFLAWWEGANPGRLANPLHVMPSQWTGQETPLGPEGSFGGIRPRDVSLLTWAYVGHVVSSTVVGAVVGAGWHRIASAVQNRSYPSAWTALVGERSSERWVLVRLENETAVIGIVDTAETDRNRRDILLKCPLRLNRDAGGYVTTSERHLFVPAGQVRSISVLRWKVGQLVDQSLSEDMEAGRVVLPVEDDRKAPDTKAHERGRRSASSGDFPPKKPSSKEPPLKESLEESLPKGPSPRTFSAKKHLLRDFPMGEAPQWPEACSQPDWRREKDRPA